MFSQLDGFELELLPASSGVLEGYTQCSMLVRRLGDTSLAARLALQFNSDDAFSHAVEVSFYPGDEDVVVTIEWPQHRSNTLSLPDSLWSTTLPFDQRHRLSHHLLLFLLRNEVGYDPQY